jgi:hypothetical protein
MSTFQRQQYVEVAKVIASLVSLDDGQRAYVAAKFAVDFQRDNPRFNDKRFYEAADVPPHLRVALAGIAKRAVARSSNAPENEACTN